MLRSRLIALALFFLVSVAFAQFGGQPGSANQTTPTPLVNLMLRYVSDPHFATELNLTAEQIKKLTDYRQTVWDEAYSARPSEMTKLAEARSRATEKLFKDVLTPAQFERARQLAARSVTVDVPRGKAATKDVTSLSSRTLLTYPELGDILTLNETQKLILAKLANPTGAKSFSPTTDVPLTGDQTKTLEKFVGAAPAQPFAAATDPRLGRTGPFANPLPADLTLIRVKDVQVEMKLSEEQVKTVGDLSTRWINTGRSTRPASDLSPKERDQDFEVLKTETDKFLASGLQPDQVKRLQQINLQRVQYNTTRDGFLRTPEVAKGLGLSEQQVKQLETVGADWEAAMVKVFEKDQNFEATNKAVAVVNTARVEKANEVLTPEQTAKLKDLIGEPYRGTYTTSPFGPGGFGPPGGGDRGPGGAAVGGGVAQPPAAGGAAQPPLGGFGQPGVRGSDGFGKHILDLPYIARNPDVQTELKMTADQVEKATTAYANLPTLGGRGNGVDATGVDARALRSQKAVKEILSEDQQKRLRQIMIQIYDAPTSTTNSYTIYGPVAYPGVAEAIKLTDEQKTKILGGTKAADVLSADQQKAIKDMYGEAFKGRTSLTAFAKLPGDAQPPGGFQPDRGFSSTAIPARIRLLNGATLDEPLKITAEQRKSIGTAYADYSAARQKAISESRPTADTRNKAMAAVAESFEKDVAKILSAEQRTRFDQLLVQHDAAESLLAVLKQPVIVTKLVITPEQSQKLAAVFADDEKIATLLTAQRLPAQKQNDLAMKIRDRSDAHLFAVLTAQQQAMWKEIIGEPYTGFRKTTLGPRPGFGAGGGGFGGGVGGPGN